MVGTFLKKEPVKVKVSKNEPKKVASTVGTFLKYGFDDLQKIRLATSKTVYISSNPTLSIFSLT
jgi:hypothetical protein